MKDDIAVVPYCVLWVERFREEERRLRTFFPADFIVRIEHFGSTAVPGLAAKPVVDMMIEIADVARGKTLIPRILEPLGYDCFWRPSAGDDIPPWYTWCIRRNESGIRTHHLHFVERGGKEDELRFRDLLRSSPVIASQYGELKTKLASEFKHDRVAYTEAKGAFIAAVLRGD